jgi:hypothetical protein
MVISKQQDADITLDITSWPLANSFSINIEVPRSAAETSHAFNHHHIMVRENPSNLHSYIALC